MKRICLVFLLSLAGVGYATEAPTSAASGERYQQVSRAYIYQQKSVPVYRYKVLKTYPHSTQAYTEGLVAEDGFYYESTGLYGKSVLHKINLKTGQTEKVLRLKKIYFGEGLTLFDNKIYQLTYKSNLGFIYDKNSFKLIKTFSYPYQGWGLSHDNNHIIMTNGSAAVLFLDPKTFKLERYIVAHDSKTAVGFLNDLEYIKGVIYTNIWQTMLIAMIDPANGKMLGWIDMTGINPNPKIYKYPYVLNGISYDRLTGNILVTGKNWPSIYEIKLVKVK